MKLLSTLILAIILMTTLLNLSQAEENDTTVEETKHPPTRLDKVITYLDKLSVVAAEWLLKGISGTENVDVAQKLSDNFLMYVEVKRYILTYLSEAAHRVYRDIFGHKDPKPTTTEELRTEPPSTDAATIKPSTTETPVTEPPTTEPPFTEPPSAEPPTTEALVTEPPFTEPPSTDPPTTEDLVTEFSFTEPPITEPPFTELSTTNHPSTVPISTEEEYIDAD